MDYVIRTPNQKTYIRLGENGTPETCTEKAKQLFEYSKAKNVLKNLPKVYQKFHFKVEAMPEIENKNNEQGESASFNTNRKKKTIKADNYVVPIPILNWVERVKNCNNLALDAMKRKEELIKRLSNVDKELSNLLHGIELQRNLDACKGYKEYKCVKTTLEKRREIKDELAIVSTILESNLSSLATRNIECAVLKLQNREFHIREVTELKFEEAI